MARVFAVLLCGLLAACGASHTKHARIVTSDSALASSQEQVVLSNLDASGMEELRDWVDDDTQRPSHSYLACSQEKTTQCVDIARFLMERNIQVDVKQVDSPEEEAITLTYKRKAATACDKDGNASGFLSSKQPSLIGCSATSNLVQMIGDTNQITRPNVLKPPYAMDKVISQLSKTY